MRATMGRLFAVRLLGACMAMTMLDACQLYAEQPVAVIEDDMPPISLDRDAAQSDVAAARNQCVASGGTLLQAGRLGRYACYAQYADGGTSCTDSTECDGDCRAVGDAQTGQRAYGQCTADANPFGCYASVEDGVVGGYVCVD